MNAALAGGVTSLVAAVAGLALWQDPRSATVVLAEAAERFLAALPPELQKKASAPLASEDRTVWNFVPQQYPGIALAELDRAQKAAVHALLRAVLSTQGHLKTTAIIQLETVLRAIEGAGGRDASHRDSGRYWLQVFGTPRKDAAWAFRLQGHHVSLHFAVADGKLVGASPAFLGANPHEVRDGPMAGTRVLAAEEDLARELLAALTPEQRAKAILAVEAPRDVILGPGRAADGLGAPQGLPWSAMQPDQRLMLWRLIEEYVNNRKRDFAEQELARIRDKGLDGVHFAWAGSTERGHGHYYRVHGPTFVIEYDNTQNDANHVHTVFRDLERDFGGDLLRAHYEHGHAHK
jgi:hypothetical protein